MECMNSFPHTDRYKHALSPSSALLLTNVGHTRMVTSSWLSSCLGHCLFFLWTCRVTVTERVLKELFLFFSLMFAYTFTYNYLLIPTLCLHFCRPDLRCPSHGGFPTWSFSPIFFPSRSGNLTLSRGRRNMNRAGTNRHQED